MEILADSWRFEEMLETVLCECIAATRGALALRCAFETIGADALFVVRLSAGASKTPWRLGARSRELIDAMAGGWELASEGAALTLFLPARLRAPTASQPATDGNIVTFDRSRKGSR